MEKKVVFCIKVEGMLLCNGFSSVTVGGMVFQGFPRFDMTYLKNESEQRSDRMKITIAKGYKCNFTLLYGKRIAFFHYSLEKSKIINDQVGIITAVFEDEASFELEVSGLSLILENKIGNYYSKTCRAQFGDKKCGISLKEYCFSGEVASYAPQGIIKAVKLPENQPHFAHGHMEIAGEVLPVSHISEDEIFLLFEASVDIKKGDKFQLFQGCNKTIKSCTEIYNNAINFRGEPFIYKEK